MCLSWQNKSFVATKVCLSWQNICRDIFLTNICHDEHNSVKHVFVMTNISRDRNIWLGQKYICHDKCFVMATTLLLRQKTCFVMTNMFVVTAVATDSHNFLFQRSLRFCCCPTPSQTMGFLTWPTPGKAPPPPLKSLLSAMVLSKIKRYTVAGVFNKVSETEWFLAA